MQHWRLVCTKRQPGRCKFYRRPYSVMCPTGQTEQILPSALQGKGVKSQTGISSPNMWALQALVTGPLSLCVALPSRVLIVAAGIHRPLLSHLPADSQGSLAGPSFQHPRISLQ
uniref:Uncharacterized protein n=1 Tax=Opuntia streptacantha TaxID=393608 RepID=A0A7C9E186_OPUST